MKILFNPPLAMLIVGFFYAVGFLAFTLNQTKESLLKRTGEIQIAGALSRSSTPTRDAH